MEFYLGGLSVPNCISASEFKQLLHSGAAIELIDVRTPAEFQELHIEIARNEPLSRLDPQALQAARNGSAEQPLYIVCRSGARGQQACQKLIAAGITSVVNIEGGTLACEAAGIPVVRGKKSVPLNCQVQIVTGLAVLLGAALSVWVHPWWAALPAIMGAGLIFSGATNTCALGNLLGRMPWNQCSDGRCSPSPGTSKALV